MVSSPVLVGLGEYLCGVLNRRTSFRSVLTFVPVVATMLIRRATFEDVPAVARLLLAALSKESPWSIFVSAEAQADADCVKYVEAMLQSHLQSVDVGEGHFWVVELSGTEDGTHPESVIVSAAICEAFPASSSDSCSSSASSYLSVASSSMLPLGRPSSKNCQTGGSGEQKGPYSSDVVMHQLTDA